MAAVATAPAGSSARWIVNRRVDLGLVIGSALAGYADLLLFTALHVKISLLWWFWSVGSMAPTFSPLPAALTSIPRRAYAAGRCSRVRFLLRLRPDTLLPGQPHLAGPPRSRSA